MILQQIVLPVLSLPLHPLFVHGAVVFIPLAALAAIYFPLVSKHRWLTRWPAAVLQLLAVVFLMAARLTGDPLAHQIESTKGPSELIHKHDQLAGLLTIATFPMVALTLFACWALPSLTPLPDGKGARTGRFDKLHLLITIGCVILAIAVIVLTVLTGDAGAKATWSN